MWSGLARFAIGLPLVVGSCGLLLEFARSGNHAEPQSVASVDAARAASFAVGAATYDQQMLQQVFPFLHRPSEGCGETRLSAGRFRGSTLVVSIIEPACDDSIGSTRYRIILRRHGGRWLAVSGDRSWTCARGFLFANYSTTTCP